MSPERRATDTGAYLRVIRILAEASSLDAATPPLLETIAELFDWQAGSLWLVEEEGDALRRVASWSADHIDSAAFDKAGMGLRLRPGEGLPGRVWAEGTAAWVEDVGSDPSFLRASAATASGLLAAVAFPVTAHTTVGVLEFLTTTLRPLDQGTVSAMTTMGRQIGEAIERSRTEALLRASEEVMAAVIASALECVITMNAEGCVVDFNPAAERTFGYSRERVVGEELAELIIPPRLRDRHRSGLRRVLSGEPSPILNKRIELTGLRANGEEFPVELTVVQARAGAQPLFAGFIRDVSERKEAEETQRHLLAAERDARLRAEAAERRSRELAATLQQSLLPPRLPVIPGFEVAARFRAGGEGVEVGGDFYDLVSTGAGGWGLVVGDVCGKGPAAATVAGLARYTVRAVVMHRTQPSAVLSDLNETLLAHGEGALTSVAYAALNPGELCVAIGGHPKPLIVKADGSVIEAGITGTILGLTHDAELVDDAFGLQEGDLALFYTDGVTETRTPEGRFGLERLRASVQACAGGSPSQLVDHVLSCTVDHPGHFSDDDVAVLALRTG